MTAGAGRQHAGITGQVENCQTVVFAAYVTARAHALLDFRLYLPKQWCQDRKRRARAHIPDDTEFTTKPALGTQMVTGAAEAGVPFAWVAADEVYGRGAKLAQVDGLVARRREAVSLGMPSFPDVAGRIASPAREPQ
jgi:SRSO17 transposase